MKTETVIKEDNHQKISIISDDKTQIKYIERRIYDDKRELYKILQTLKHPNLIKICDITFDTATVIHEEYIDAVSLSDFMENGQTLTKTQIKKIALQISDAMEALHSVNIIHRDIKPGNILINKDFHAWLIDYDIARIYRPEIRQDTEIRGTFGYAPIEQYGMMPTDFKTDIYAFGVTLSKLLEYYKIKGKMNRIAEKCRKFDPSERYEDAGKLRKVLSGSGKVQRTSVIFAVLIAITLSAVIYVTCLTKPELSSNEDLFHERTSYNHNSSSDNGADSDSTMNEKNNSEDTFINSDSDVHGKTENTPTKNDTGNRDGTKITTEPPDSDNSQLPDNIPSNQHFVNFRADDVYQKYATYHNFSDVMFFKTSNECNHMLMLNDGRNKGKVKLNGTFVDADFYLNSGTLDVTLSDNNGHTFNHSFKFENTYSYDKTYTSDLIKTVDMICADISNDGNAELIIGLSEGVIEVSDGVFFSDFNYCVAWCVTYNTSSGFKLAKGMMFSRGTFFVDSVGNIMPANSGWGDEPYIYYLDGDCITSLMF